MGAVEEGLKILREDFKDLKEDLRSLDLRYSSQIIDLTSAIRQNSEALNGFIREAKHSASSQEKSAILDFVAGNAVKKVLFGSAGASIFYSAMHFLFKHLQW